MTHEMLPAELLLELVRMRQRELHRSAAETRLAMSARRREQRQRERTISRAARWLGQALGWA